VAKTVTTTRCSKWNAPEFNPPDRHAKFPARARILPTEASSEVGGNEFVRFLNLFLESFSIHRGIRHTVIVLRIDSGRQMYEFSRSGPRGGGVRC
jgi:hypothetical protein